MYLLSEIESDSRHARNCVILVRLKTIPTIKNLISREPVMYLLSEIESGSKHARNCVILVRLKTIPTIKNLISRGLLNDGEM